MYFGEFSNHRIRTLSQLLKSEQKIEWCVSDLLKKGGKSCLVGDAGVGKSFFLVQLGWSIASGQSFLGEYEITTPMNVLLLDTELGGGAIDERVKLMKESASADCRKEFYFYDATGVKLTDSSFRKSLIEYIKENQIGVLLLDSIVYLHDLDENAAEIRSFLIKLDQIISETGCSIFMSHHTSQADPQGKKGGRGHTVLKGWVEIMLSIYFKKGMRLLKYQKARHMEKPDEEFLLGFDEHCWFKLLNCPMLGTLDTAEQKHQKKIEKIEFELKAMKVPMKRSKIHAEFIHSKNICNPQDWLSIYIPQLLERGKLVDYDNDNYGLPGLLEASEKC